MDTKILGWNSGHLPGQLCALSPSPPGAGHFLPEALSTSKFKFAESWLHRHQPFTLAMFSRTLSLSFPIHEMGVSASPIWSLTDVKTRYFHSQSLFDTLWLISRLLVLCWPIKNCGNLILQKSHRLLQIFTGRKWANVLFPGLCRHPISL